ncbi:MAG: sulfatase-like hydrolase/transferase [Chloroflexi bacterium]|jgi:arylsulfatase A-like enzyme|nr:sulfatase-like hydrolase/transferase [Chloroflexota bacterium]
MITSANQSETYEIKSSTVRSHQIVLSEPADRPNILLLMTDQQRFDTINAAGYSHMHTPNLDRLAREGGVYTHAYSPNPICLAARQNLLTGLTARHHGLPDNVFGGIMRPDLPTIPRILSDNGYETRAIGKMHFLPPRRHIGFDKLELMEELPFFREQDEYALYLKEVGLGHIQNIHGIRNLLYMLPQRSLIPEEHHGSKWVADRAIDFIQTNAGRHPFFLFCSWIAPHPPFDVPDRLADLYADADLPQPAVSQTPTSALSEENRMLGDLPDGAYVRRMREVYFAAITYVDEQIGRLLKTLEKLGQIENTLIIFVSDHGEMLGDLDLYQKWLPYDAAARIPFILHYPEKVAPGSTCGDFVDLNDILPTILDAAGLSYPGDAPLPGESIFSQDPQKDRSWQYTEYGQHNRRWISIRNKATKYNYYYGGGYEELFDLQRDPQETKNLLALEITEAVEDLRLIMREKLLFYEQTFGLEGYATGSDFKRGEPYIPHPQRNEAFPRFPDKLTDPAEAAAMNDFLDEVAQAVAQEPVVKLRDLDIAAWQVKGGFSDEEIRRLLQVNDQRRGR